MPRILPFKDPEPEEINGFKDITEAVNFLDIIIQCDVVRNTLANSPGDGIYQRFRTFPQ